MAGKQQFDEYLGGSHKLPTEVHIMKLVSSRASEIAAMTYSIENPQQTKLVFQKLPVHMRRRVMSHNAKRLPRRLREAHLNQMTKSGLPPKSKRPSRRYRRRPQNLLSEYTRRQRNKVWLETHIWHAKRFHMVEKWGYRIASHANDKCFKANYRAVARHCLMQDISYYTCVELNGPEDCLKETLKTHCNPTELTISAKIYTGGKREGTLMFYKKNGFPEFPIGNVHFLWRPSQTNSKTIWIWVHPSFFEDFIAEITSSFELKLQTEEGTESIYANHNCRMYIFKNTLNRFRFYGPLAISVLTNALRLPKFDENVFLKMDVEGTAEFEDLNEISKTCNESADLKNVDEKSKTWFSEYYRIQENLESLKTQRQLWQVLKTLESPCQLPPNIVLGFTVLDPRFYLPDKRTKSRGDACSAEIMPVPPTHANSSPLWDIEIRRKVTTACPKTSAINKLRSECLVPGVENDKYFSEHIMAKIPILLIQKPGNSAGLSSGLDMILPAGWAMPFWLALILRCARVGALRESRSIAFEYENIRSPDVNDPDTPAYAREATSTKLELTEKYFRYPPNRRVNFIKLGICSPFFCEWKILMKDWTNSEDFYVLRNKNLLSVLQRAFPSKMPTERKSNEMNWQEDFSLEDEFKNKNCLIHVKLSVLKKGCPRRFAIICMPTPEDIEKFKRNNHWSGPVEKLNPDPNESVRKTLRRNHIALLKRLKRQRIRRRKAVINALSKVLAENAQRLYQMETKSLLGPNPEIIREQSQKMLQLYLPKCTNVRNSCDREVMGYLTAADFSFTKGKGTGIGYVTLSSLIELINKGYNFVLVRNPQTRQYRIANLDITV